MKKNKIASWKWLSPQKKIVPFDYMKNGSLHKKSNFWFLSERQKWTSFVLFALLNASEKGTKKNSFWLHDVKKERYLY